MMQYSVVKIFESYNASPNNPRDTAPKKSGIKIRLLESLILKLVVRSLLIHWVLLLGKAALKVYAVNQEEEKIQAFLADL